jgi:hypothetical protein
VQQLARPGADHRADRGRGQQQRSEWRAGGPRQRLIADALKCRPANRQLRAVRLAYRLATFRSPPTGAVVSPRVRHCEQRGPRDSRSAQARGWATDCISAS